LSALSLGRSLGISRHQLLVHPDIPYTSHNSSLCIGFETAASLDEIIEPCREYILEVFPQGADPGLCVVEAAQVPQDVVDFGRRAITEVLKKAEALSLAAGHGIFLAPLGGTGGGVIGSLAAVGLRVDGQEGRFVDLSGIREAFGNMTVAEILEKTAVELVCDAAGGPLGPGEVIDTGNWLRPSLKGGRPVLPVEMVPGDRDNRVWQPLNYKHKEKKGDADER
jgi:hypothetical protein